MLRFSIVILSGNDISQGGATIVRKGMWIPPDSIPVTINYGKTVGHCKVEKIQSDNTVLAEVYMSKIDVEGMYPACSVVYSSEDIKDIDGVSHVMKCNVTSVSLCNLPNVDPSIKPIKLK